MYKVLLIDDNKLVGEIVTQYLGRLGFIVDYINSPFGVINRVKQFTPDVVLLDINIPGLKGDKIARLLNDHRGRLPEFTLIAFSSEDENIQRELVESKLIDGYILKTGKVNGLETKISAIAATGSVASA